MVVGKADAVIPSGTAARMAETLRHRGPDDIQAVELPQAQLGHTRLAVIDLAGGSQPMTDADQRAWIVFNGEIFNFRELRAELTAAGHVFRSQSDTEVLLHAWLEWGREAPRRLNGQFAMAIWDPQARTLFAARDRLGEKPLYWAATPEGHLVVASELRAILASGLVAPRIDPVSVEAFLALLYVPPDRTIYENIHTLRPGHWLGWSEAGMTGGCYWSPQYSSAEMSFDEAADGVREKLARAVQRQMVADVPVGAFLSGGLDSSSIVALMAPHASSAVQTFSVGFGDLINELPFARQVAEMYRTEHHELQMDIAVGEVLERIAGVYDEPFADPSNIPTYLVAGFAREQVKVVLSGDGGDELFGGYSWYSPRLKECTGLGPALRRGLGLAADPWEVHVAAMRYFLPSESTGLRGGNGTDAVGTALRAAYAPGAGVRAMDRLTDFDLRCYLPGDILVKVDRAAMAHGLETRAPFLDVELVEFVLSLPWRLRFHGGQLKELLRRACAPLWPEAIRTRSKQGFGPPLVRWLERADVRSLWARVGGDGGRLAELLPGLPAHRAALGPYQIWPLLCLGLWLENHPTR